MNASLSDEELMTRVHDGAAEDLAVLFERYQVPLFQFFWHMTNQRALSEDLVQDTFYRILKNRQQYRAGRPFRAWLYQIARNAGIDEFRKQRPEVGLEAAPPLGSIPVDHAAQDEQAQRLRQALLCLPEDKREVLVLCRYQELKYEQIATVLGCAVGTVKVRVHRALQELRETYLRLERKGIGR